VEIRWGAVELAISQGSKDETKTKDLVVKIDQRLAAEYRVAYQRAFGSAGQKEPSLTQAMEHFLALQRYSRL
jgi:hypothetical protein